jgi:O-antigen/teichoic acid export membrane protein
LIEATERARVLRGATTLGLRSIFSLLVGLAYFALLGRIVGVEGMGVVSILSLLYTLFPLVLTAATPTAIIKHLGESLGRGDSEAVAGLLRTTLSLSLCMGAAGTLLAWLSSYPLSVLLLNGRNLPSLQLLSIAIGTFTASAFLSAAFSGFQRFGRLSLIFFTGSVSGQALSAALLLLGLGIPAFVFSWIVENLINIALMLSLFPRAGGTSTRMYPVRPLLAFGIPLFVATAISYLGSNVFVRLFILGSFSLSTLGEYEAALRLAGVLGTFFNSFLSSLFPHLSKVYGETGTAGVELDANWAFRLSSMVFTPIFIGGALVSSQVFNLLLGAPFSDAALIFSVFMAFAVPTHLLSIFLLAVQASGRSIDILLIQAVATLIQVFSCLTLLRYGFLGVAVGASTLGVVASVLGSCAFRRRLNATVDWSGALRYVLSALCVVPPVLVSLTLFPQPVFLPVHVCLGTVTYLAAVRIGGGVRRDDLEALSLLLPRGLRPLAQRILGHG